ncbi:MAG: RNA-directed DNA polymerase [Kiritimatiellae bacterium]|nr:RNA-directed DNA polymerase [Kiritimatiellia bacterium]
MTKRAKVRSKPKIVKVKERSVLEMTPTQARAFFLKPESYCSVELPAYFRFGAILSAVAKILKKKPLVEMSSKPHQHEGVNYSLLSNKDGRHAWRPFQLIHPALYVSLVDQITAPDKWAFIRDRFKEFHELKKFNCLSIPIRSLSKRKDKAAQILQWWQGIEQQSIELAMEYEYVFHADITDCYGAIYTHSIVWALHGRPAGKDKRSDKSLIGNVIDWHIQDMRHGQTNGIPQGSALMDFIAEMVLGFADLELSAKLERSDITEYRILRYRDDYRVFVNNPQAGEAILKALTEVLIGLGMRLNTAKTTRSQSVISSSLKPDKRAWLRGRQGDANLQKHLLIIHAHGLDHPNAGSLVIALTHYLQRLSRVRRPQHPRALISIAVDIAYSSPRTFPVCAAIVSRLLRSLGTETDRAHVLKTVYGKLSKLPNTGLMEVWLQRIGHFYEFHPDYEEALCRIVAEKKTALWNNDWITAKALKDAITPARVFDKVAFKAMKPVVPPSEVEMFASERY